MSESKKQLSCFIIMPFSKVEFIDDDGEKHSLDYTQLEYICDELFVKAVKSYDNNEVSFINVHRNNTPRGNFVKDIVGNLQEYDLVLADLTGLNPNVFYELGIRNTFTNGTIMVTQHRKGMPSDLNSYIQIRYDYFNDAPNFMAYYPKFEKELHHLIDDFIKDRTKIDNPVREFIKDRIIFRNEERIKEIERNIEVMHLVIFRYRLTMNNYKINFHNWTNGNVCDTYCESLTGVSVPFLSRLINLNESHFVMAFIDDLTRCFISINSKMSFIKINKGGFEGIPLTLLPVDNVQCQLPDLLKLYDIDEKGDYYTCSKPDEEPMLKSFNHFINEWEKELKELTK